MTNPSLALIKCLVSIAVTAVAVVPRMPFDHPWSIGGNLSYRFRQLLLVLCGYRIVKFVFADYASVMPSQLIVGINGLESTLICFLTLLTPYLLRVWLSDVINIPGRGKGLEVWLYVVAALCFSGISLELVGFTDDIWMLKKIGDCLTFFPVTRTVALYNTITHPSGNYPGRGTVLSQIILVVEWYSLFAHGSDAIAKFLHMVGLMEDDFYWNSLMRGLRGHNLFASLVRIMCHSIFLNVLDESYQLRNASTSSQSDGPSSRRGSTESNSSSRSGSPVGRWSSDAVDEELAVGSHEHPVQEIVSLVKHN
mmetsp:Transcript_21155/g.38298  ORF Transcript_21155/g.38298 Transcript_21155/m.38298 type:complete len:309 (+) Transcript_21155:221-1147(+)|eukprot:CAMPEP_0201897388 /NCGR_PEP_ID=MMETSP0902-20130614/46444_1 /ASSEMBLY_ACC=CAM_ASM_000551 /TAXON_ID=420261 /ORGANISM="Thalassiosira antarctica, Strain CCMP982" /LENGTH=308 /DNA_ID=CAMNT_0048430245 /DNA_START=134 /DNA_END=1060 /DNA_ORIENTATION=+